jgi:DNA-binding transcriptional MerR regulator
MRTIEAARRAGCSVQQLHKLEAAGVLPDVPRTPSGYRVYDDTHVASAVAYRALATGVGPAEARVIMAAAHQDESRFLALFDAAHAAIAQERIELAAAGKALRSISSDPLVDVRPEDDLSIGELAAALDVRTSALRHWEAEGLLSPRRGPHGERTFGPADVRDARLIQQLRQAGYRIPPLRELLPQLRNAEETALALTQRARHLDERSRALLRAGAALAGARVSA